MHNVKTQFESRTHEAKAPCFGGQFGLGSIVPESVVGNRGYRAKEGRAPGVASYDTSIISCYMYLLGA